MLDTRAYSDVNYYDQLGVASTATPEQIRHAYRSLVRLLHPDQQTDPELKGAAENQLRKLNRIHSILIDPDKRNAYDEFLAVAILPASVAAESREHLRKTLLRGGAIVAAIITVVVIFWLSSESSPIDTQPRQAVKVQPAPATSAAAAPDPARFSQQVIRLQEELLETMKERDDLYREVTQLRGWRNPPRRTLLAPDAAQPRPKAGNKLQQNPAEVPGSQPARSPAPAAANPPSAPSPDNSTARIFSRQLAGFWLYVRPKEGQQNRNRALYPPEFIEVNIQEKNGFIAGKYRARYRILDKAISPDVNFEIWGKENEGRCACVWRGIGGARGQINLQIIGENTMKFDWTAAELGTQQGLSSGTANLTRRAE